MELVFLYRNQMTLKSGVEMTIKKHVPQIEEVVSVAPA